MAGPVGDLPALHVARPDGDVVALAQGLHERRQRTRIVGEVGVHLDEHVVAVLHAPDEPGPVGAAQTGLAGAGDEMDVGQFGRHALDDVAGPVGAPVVDDQHPGFGQRFGDAVQDPLDVLGLVICRNDDQGPHPGHSRGTKPPRGVRQR